MNAMYRNKLWILLVAMISLITSCEVLEQVGQMQRFAECNFSIANVSVNSIAGIDLSKIHSESDLDMGKMLMLGQALAQGNLPADLTVTLKADNPNTKTAAISGLDWEVLMKDVSYGSGKLNQRVEVAPDSSATFPLRINFDLLKVITSQSLNDLVAFVLDSKNKEKLKKLDVKAKIRPWYQRGSEVKPAPAFITIRP